MPLLDYILERPSYGWKDSNGDLIIPTKRQLYSEAFSRMNIFKSSGNGCHSRVSWTWACMLPFLLVTQYFSWLLVLVAMFYSLIAMGTHGTIWVTATARCV
jgi:stearoyl-CoA desaturase (delta-9 desaturase)